KKEKKGKKDKKSRKKSITNPLSKLPNPLIILWKIPHSFKNLKLDYAVDDNFAYMNKESMPGWKFQLGFTDEANVEHDPTFGKIYEERRWRHTEKFSSAVQFSPFSILSINLNFNTNTTRNEQQGNVTGASQYNYFILGEDPTLNKDIMKLIPNWNIKLRNLQKYFGMDKYIKSLSMEHARSGQYKVNTKLIEGNEANDGETFTTQYQPFLSVNGNLKWDINFSLNHSRSASYSFTPSGNAQKQLNGSYNITLRYSHTGGFTLPLPFMKNKKIKNEISFNMQVQTSTNKSYTRRASDNLQDKNKFVEMDVSNNLNISPGFTYRLSRNINGEVFVVYRKQKNKRMEHTHFEMGIRVNIQIR
ncbi:MAG: hypothetical protein KAR38_01865, partial [Calditrichia bacterium]|nr:hypothetical protein [Calditrichia bacterium]